jgi:hypothetical protein
MPNGQRYIDQFRAQAIDLLKAFRAMKLDGESRTKK